MERLIYRQSRWTRLTHWTWAICLFFLLATGLQIFNARPWLSIGQETGFDYDNSILKIGARDGVNGPMGYTQVFGREFDTTGYLGLRKTDQGLATTAVPEAFTIPSNRDLATGRIIHFFAAWIFLATLVTWLISSALNGHLRRDILPSRADFKAVPQAVADHVRLRFRHDGRYNPLQKFSYFGVLFILFPLMIVTGLAMSPGMNAVMPVLTDMFGGRQTARTVHFVSMLLLFGFFIIHMVMILAAGPLNELRSIITGWYRVDADQADEEKP